MTKSASTSRCVEKIISRPHPRARKTLCGLTFHTVLHQDVCCQVPRTLSAFIVELVGNECAPAVRKGPLKPGARIRQAFNHGAEKGSVSRCWLYSNGIHEICFRFIACKIQKQLYNPSFGVDDAFGF